MAQNGNQINIFELDSDDAPIVHSHLQTETDGIELTKIPGYSESPIDDVIQNDAFHLETNDQNPNTDLVPHITSDIIIENAPSKMLLNQCKFVGMMEDFCSDDDEGMIQERDFNKKLRSIKREASQKSLRKHKIKRRSSKKKDNSVNVGKSVPVSRLNDPASPVVIINDNIEFEWQASQEPSPNEIDEAPKENVLSPRNVSSDTIFRQPNNVRDRRATALLRRDEIKRQCSEHGYWYTAKHIHFERFKSKWNNAKSVSLWSREMKHVESIFGTAVVSYFIFLRFIFLINLFLFVIMTMFVIVPQIVYNYVLQPNSTLEIRQNFTIQSDLLGLFTGSNWFESTELFYGSYTNEIIAVPKRPDPENAIFQYNMPYAYIFTVLIIFLIFLIALIYKLGVAFRESYGTLGDQRSVEFCNRVFGAWDFGICNESAAKLRHRSIATDLKEEIDEQNSKDRRRTWKDWLVVILVRIFFNICTFLLLIISGIIIVFSTLWALATRCPGVGYLQLLGINIPGVVNSFTIVILNFVLQLIFPFFARYERFHSQSGELKMTLVRSVLIRLASLIALTLTLFASYQFIQNGLNNSFNETGFNPQEVTDFINTVLNLNLNTTSFECLSFSCWETYFGQEFYRLAIANFIFAIITTLFPEISRFLLHRFGPRVWNSASKCISKQVLKKYLNIIANLATSPPEFYIAKSVLDLIYAQALMLLGFFFCPFLPFITMITFFVLFYVKKYSCVWFCSPSSRGLYRSARNNLFYILLLFLIYFTSLAAILYLLINLNPSDMCGPFRNFETFVGPIEKHLTSEAATTIINLIQSPGVTYSVITMLLLLAYAQYIIVRSYKKNVTSLRRQLVVESADKQYFCDQLRNIFDEADNLRQLHNFILQTHYNSEVEYEFEFRERLSSIANSLGAASAGTRLSWMGTNEREKLVNRRRKTSNLDGIFERTERKQD